MSNSKNNNKFLSFSDCTNTNKYLLSNSSNVTYNSLGSFYCEQGFNLIPENVNVSTVCTRRGVWKNKNKVDCVRGT